VTVSPDRAIVRLGRHLLVRLGQFRLERTDLVVDVFEDCLDSRVAADQYGKDTKLDARFALAPLTISKRFTPL
jgi:hypothetical protein